MSATDARSSALPSPAPTASSPQKQARQLACIACQQRKLKCDRQIPCSRCLKSGVQCVPADSIPKTRKKRLAERQLLNRLRHYEALLRQHDIAYEPLHGNDTASEISYRSADAATGSPVSADASHQAAASSRPREAKDIWQAMSQTNRNRNSDGVSDDEDSQAQPDIVRNVVVQNAYDQMYESHDHLLFGANKKDLDLATMHPPTSRIFKYWQLFLDNANPLLKVVHASSFQARLVDAVNDLSVLSPVMHALLFSIYAMSIHSLDDLKSQELFGTKKEDLLKPYHFACQQALLNCGLLRTTDREVLVAQLLYLISTRDKTDPRTISSTLGIAARIAQRMGLHSEASNVKCPPFEAEMRRRLWWALVIFDSRISDMAGNKAAILLTPTWDCRTPRNVDDSQLWPDMAHEPTQSRGSSDAVFIAVRSEIDDVIRSSGFFLDFTNPILKPLAATHHNDSLATLVNRVENDFLAHCSLNNRVHFMTLWSARGLLAKYQLFSYYSSQSGTGQPPTDTQRDQAASYCLRMLDADTKLMNSPVTKGFHWLIHFYFPFPAFLHIVQDIRRRPTAGHVQRCWDSMSDNYEARFLEIEPEVGLFHRLIARLIVQTWLDTRFADRQVSSSRSVPRIVAHVARKLGITELSVPSGSSAANLDSLIRTEEGGTRRLDPFAGLSNPQSSSYYFNSFQDLSDYGIDFKFDGFDSDAFDLDTIFAPL